MPRIPRFSPLWWLTGTLLLALACSHDSPRDNPLDPTLTPPVELQVALDDTAGTATLTWTRYEGEAEFGEYWVLRNVPGLVRVDTTVLTDPGQTSFTDASAVHGTSYSYRVCVVNSDGLVVSSQAKETGSLTLPSVQILSAAFDARTATVTLQWTPYKGPRFAAYRLRRTEGPQSIDVARLVDGAVTSFVDSGLAGGTEYSYDLSVLTDRHEEIAGDQVTGGFHLPVQVWPLPIGGEDETAGVVRLYSEPGGRIAALHKSLRGPVRLLLYDKDGGLMGNEILLDPVPANRVTERSASTALLESGGRQVSAAGSLNAFGVLHIDDQGSLVRAEHDLSSGFGDRLSGMEATVAGEIRLGSVVGRGDYACFDKVTVSADGGVVHQDDFDEFPVGRDPDAEDWSSLFGPLEAVVRVVTGAEGRLRVWGPGIRKSDDSWTDFELGVDVSFEDISVTVQMGSDTLSSLLLTLDADTQQATLRWRFVSPAESAQEDRDELYSVPVRLLQALPYHLRLGAVEGRVRASVESPVLWGEETERPPVWVSLAAIDDRVALVVDDQPYVIDPDGELTTLNPYEDWVSEIRSWQPEGERVPRIGACFPESGQIRWGTAILASRWNASMRQVVGPFTDLQTRDLSHPVSFDVGPDGRFYVVDAGNHRLVVFDPAGNYITQIGHQGSDQGEFSFGSGLKIQRGLDFAGSIVVDDEGYIYVADVGNKRIQKFAP